MRYVERVMQPDETLVYVTGLHWLIYWRAIVLFVLAIGALVLARFLSDPNLVDAALIAAAAFAVLGAFAWLRGAIHRWSTELAITDRRVIFKRGVLRRHTIEMNMAKIESVDVDQSVLGRIFDYGTVTIRGTGGGVEPLRNIRAPIAFRNRVTAG